MGLGREEREERKKRESLRSIQTEKERERERDSMVRWNTPGNGNTLALGKFSILIFSDHMARTDFGTLK